MKIIRTLAIICLTACASLAQAINVNNPPGFGQSNLFDSPRFEVSTPYSSQIVVSFKLTDIQPGKKLFVKNDLNTSAEDPNQIVELFADPQLQLPLYANPIDLDQYRDNTVHSVAVYVKYFTTGQGAMNKTGTFNFSTPLFINGDSTEYSTNLNMTADVTGTCRFLQSSYNVLKTSPSNTIVKDSTTVSYNCGTNIAPMISVDSVSYISDEDPNVTMKVFSDSSYSQNLASNPVALEADGTNKNFTIYMQYFSNGNEIVSKYGTYNFHTILHIDY